jgi:3-oxoacid CoA-transferase subunit A
MKNWFFTGDFHGHWENFANRIAQINTENAAVVVLGDAGLNFYLNGRDRKLKKKINDLGIAVYCVRGNHEQRPKLVDGMILAYDEETENTVWYEPDFPNIKYFRDGGIYSINKRRVLVIGGAYSVDKWYRLERGWTWFEDELLTVDEMDYISDVARDYTFDYILSHTCPLSWEPTDLFIKGLDQSTVNTSMETWLDEVRKITYWDYWLFGHFHENRWVRPHVQMFYERIMSLEEFESSWKAFDEEGIIPDDINLDPAYRWFTS